jgi:hypothetical protein
MLEISGALPLARSRFVVELAAGSPVIATEKLPQPVTGCCGSARQRPRKFEAKICILICAQLWVNATNPFEIRFLTPKTRGPILQFWTLETCPTCGRI